MRRRYIDGEVGFCFQLPNAEANILIKKGKLIYFCDTNIQEADLPDFIKKDLTMIVSCRPNAFDIYFKHNDKAEFVCTFYEERFKDSYKSVLFSNGYVLIFASGNVIVKEVLSYIDNGVSIADVRAIKYENGEILLEQGKMYFTASIRMQEGSFQGVFSWIPGTAEIRMTGALFYDCGDGNWRNYVAPVMLYHREKKQWYVWVSSFEHKHILAYGIFDGEPRFGVNVIDVKFMDKALENDNISSFVGFVGDEDPDFLYDKEKDRWIMAICRLNPEIKQYSYVFFESKEPFDDYTYIGKGYDGAETGGSFVKINGELFFVCGNDSNATSEYRIYSKDGMKKAVFNYPDGGFRGWGTIIPIKMGSRTRCFWLTFDRHKGSKYNWSYGNLYCFEIDIC